MLDDVVVVQKVSRATNGIVKVDNGSPVDAILVQLDRIIAVVRISSIVVAWEKVSVVFTEAHR